MLLVSIGGDPGYRSGYANFVELAFSESRTGMAQDLGYLGICESGIRGAATLIIRLCGGLLKGIS